MPVTFTEADEAVRAMLTNVMREHHPALYEAGVRVDVLMAENPSGDAVMAGGYPTVVSVKVTGPKERAKHAGDAEATIDMSAWGMMAERHRTATIDYALEQLELVPRKKAEEGEPVWATDDKGRPRLRKKKGDWAAGPGYAACVERNGDFALEFMSIRRAWTMAQAARNRGEDGAEADGDESLSELEEAA